MMITIYHFPCDNMHENASGCAHRMSNGSRCMCRHEHTHKKALLYTVHPHSYNGYCLKYTSEGMRNGWLCFSLCLSEVFFYLPLSRLQLHTPFVSSVFLPFFPFVSFSLLIVFLFFFSHLIFCSLSLFQPFFLSFFLPSFLSVFLSFFFPSFLSFFLSFFLYERVCVRLLFLHVLIVCVCHFPFMFVFVGQVQCQSHPILHYRLSQFLILIITVSSSFQVLMFMVIGSYRSQHGLS